MRLGGVVTILGMAAFNHSANAQDSGPHSIVERTAMQLFDDMPKVELDFADDACGFGKGVNLQLAYCTSNNVILLRGISSSMTRQTYELAHLYGHAVQVRHGVADVALREILARRDEEKKLRGWVTRQVECIAGFIYAQTGLPEISLLDVYDAEPMTQSHWGRNPLTKGPKVSIGLEARAKWFAIGRKGDLSKCAVGEFGSELLVEALK